MVEAGFRGEAGFVASLDKACREFVNRNSVCKTGASKSPELLAKFCDALLRKSSKVTEEGEVEDVLNSIVSACLANLYLDDCVQVCRGQGCVSKVLQQESRQASCKCYVRQSRYGIFYD
jgi:hypothetical protein